MCDPTDLVGRQLFNVLAMAGESDLIRLRTQEDVKVAKTKGRFCGKQPKRHHRQEARPIALSKGGQRSALSSPTCSVSPRSMVSQGV